VQVTNNVSLGPAISPDGTLLFCFYRKESNSPLAASIIAFDGKGPSKTCNIPFNQTQEVKWAADGRSLLYVDTKDGLSNIWSQPLHGGPPKQLTNFRTDQIFAFDLSRDGKQLAIARGTSPSDVVLITKLK
jgi:Tol biopolymer transport system component